MEIAVVETGFVNFWGWAPREEPFNGGNVVHCHTCTVMLDDT